MVVAVPVFGALAWYTDDQLWSLLEAGLTGFFVAVLFVGWVIGAHASSLPWRWGAQGEQFTADEVEKLGSDWYCEHDIEHSHGNWDHVLVGPPGVFLLDSKALHNPSHASGDALRSGRLQFRGSVMRNGALAVRRALQGRFRQTPWVQGVFVIWREFPQQEHEIDRVVYLHGHELVPWLLSRPPRIDAPYRAAIIEALREERVAIADARQPVHSNAAQ